MEGFTSMEALESRLAVLNKQFQSIIQADLPSSPQVCKLVRSGDMFIEVRTYENLSTRYLVGSQILCSASKVFNMMFGPDSPFSESSRLNSSELGNGTDATGHVFHEGKPVFTLEDDPEMLAIALKIIHHITDDIPRKVTFEKLVQLAIIVDKYELQGAIQVWAEVWTGSFGRTGLFSNILLRDGCEDWLLVAWVFNLREDFTKLSSNLITRAAVNGDALAFRSRYTGSFFSLTDHIPESVLDRIKAEREKRVNKVRQTVKNIYTRYCGNPETSFSPVLLCKKRYDQSQCRIMQVGHMAVTMSKLEMNGAFWDKSLNEIYKRITALEGVSYPGNAVGLDKRKDMVALQTPSTAGTAPEPWQTLPVTGPQQKFPSGGAGTFCSGWPTIPSFGGTDTGLSSGNLFTGQPSTSSSRAALPVLNLVGPRNSTLFSPSLGPSVFQNSPPETQTTTPTFLGGTSVPPASTTQPSTLSRPQSSSRTPLARRRERWNGGSTSTASRITMGINKSHVLRDSNPSTTIPWGRICIECESTLQHKDLCRGSAHQDCSWLGEVKKVVEECYYMVEGLQVDSFASKQKGVR